MTRQTVIRSSLMIGAALLSACQSLPPIRTEASLDLARFMGDWYVIAAIPTFLEKEAYNPLEQYRLDEDGNVATTFTFNKGGFDGPLKTYEPLGFVSDESNAIWGMRFIWPFRAEYRVVYVDPAYSVTIIGRRKRDYVWIMAREPEISEHNYDELVTIVEEEGYDLSKLRRMPQQPLSERAGPGI